MSQRHTILFDSQEHWNEKAKYLVSSYVGYIEEERKVIYEDDNSVECTYGFLLADFGLTTSKYQGVTGTARRIKLLTGNTEDPGPIHAYKVGDGDWVYRQPIKKDVSERKLTNNYEVEGISIPDPSQATEAGMFNEEYRLVFDRALNPDTDALWYFGWIGSELEFAQPMGVEEALSYYFIQESETVWKLNPEVLYDLNSEEYQEKGSKFYFLPANMSNEMDFSIGTTVKEATLSGGLPDIYINHLDVGVGIEGKPNYEGVIPVTMEGSITIKYQLYIHGDKIPLSTFTASQYIIAFNSIAAPTREIICNGVDNYDEFDYNYGIAERLQKVTLGKSVKEIQEPGFAPYSNIDLQIPYPDSIEKICWQGNNQLPNSFLWNNLIIDNNGTEELYFGKHLLYAKPAEKKYSVKKGTKRISEGAFFNPESEARFSVSLPRTLKSIGQGAFFYTPVEEVIVGGDQVIDIEPLAFEGTPLLYESNGPIYVGKSFCGYVTEDPEITYLELNPGTEVMSANRFPMNLVDLGIPYSVKKVYPISSKLMDSGEFEPLPESFQYIYVSEDNPYYHHGHYSQSIIETETNTLVFCCNGSYIDDSVENLGDNCFLGTTVDEIFIPESVKSIGKNSLASMNLSMIECEGMRAPKVTPETFQYFSYSGTLYVPRMSTGYDTWLRYINGYWESRSWTISYI
jgi:hypothetical protein